jgi:hypothetical protein
LIPEAENPSEPLPEPETLVEVVEPVQTDIPPEPESISESEESAPSEVTVP